jgi:hypothetical protein
MPKFHVTLERQVSEIRTVVVEASNIEAAKAAALGAEFDEQQLDDWTLGDPDDATVFEAWEAGDDEALTPLAPDLTGLCRACRRPVAECNADPCIAVAMDRAEAAEPAPLLAVKPGNNFIGAVLSGAVLRSGVMKTTVLEPTPRRAMLVYQQGFANVFEVAEFGLTPETHGPARVIRANTYRYCETICEGLELAGWEIRAAACEELGDIADREWQEYRETGPFSSSRSPDPRWWR